MGAPYSAAARPGPSAPAMRIGLSWGISAREPLARVPRLAAQVEEAGFDRLWFVDYQLQMKDVFVAMTLAATATTRLKLGPGVANPRTRHLSVLANALNAINEVSDGRGLLGLGTGHTAVYGVGLRPATVAETGSAVHSLRALLAGREASTDGKNYRLATAATTPPPIYLAVTHQNMLRLAGRVADGVILMGAADPAMTHWQLDRIAEGLQEAGRSRAEIDIELWTALSVGEAEKAVQDVKPWAASQARVLNRWQGELPAGLDRFRDELARADSEYVLSEHLSLRGGNGRLISDELALRLAIAGDAATCAGRLAELARLGIDGFTVTLLSGGREQRIAAMAEALLPALRGAGDP